MRRSLESPLVRAYRELLGVAPGSKSEDLKKAYHRLALIYHPDRNPAPSAAEDFQRVRVAYEALMDPEVVRVMNENHRRERTLEVVIEGLNLTIGTFFGHRTFKPGARVERHLRLGVEKRGETDVDTFGSRPLERDVSILDDPAFDAIEVVYAGKFSVGDDERLQADLASAHVRQLPWVVLNNQGLAFVLDGNFKAASRCFTELDERIPNNIVFTYRRGLCHVVLGFTATRRSLLGREKYDLSEIEKGLAFLDKAVRLGANRSIGKQRCLVIRKLIADVQGKLGDRRKSIRTWKKIAELAPNSAEAKDRTGGAFFRLSGKA